jgi:hypothetical protein
MELSGTVEIGSSDDSPALYVTNLREQEIHSSVPGLRIFSVSIGETADSLPVSGSDQIFHKVFPGLKTPFGLPIECFPVYEKMCHNVANEVRLFIKCTLSKLHGSHSVSVRFFELKAASASEADPRAVK